MGERSQIRYERKTYHRWRLLSAQPWISAETNYSESRDRTVPGLLLRELIARQKGSRAKSVPSLPPINPDPGTPTRMLLVSCRSAANQLLQVFWVARSLNRDFRSSAFDFTQVFRCQLN